MKEKWQKKKQKSSKVLKREKNRHKGRRKEAFQN